MALDQTSIPKELRSINVARTVIEDPRISAPAPAGPPLETFNPPSIPVYFPTTVPDPGIVIAGYRNQVPGVAAWRPRPPAPLGHVSVASTVGSVCGPILGNKVAPSAPNQSKNDLVGSFGYNEGLSSRDSSNGSERLSCDVRNRNCGNSSLGSRSSGKGPEMVDDDGGDDSTSGKKVKFMCSFGGKILPRPSDGMLRYVGGQTRIISVRKHLKFNELEQKMVEARGQPVVIKYQLPDEDLDALVSVSCPEDLDNMMEEYEKLLERSPDGSAKLRVFLFSASEIDSLGAVQFGDLQDNGQRYVEAVNGVVDGISSGILRKESIASASSTQNSDFSGTDAVDSSAPAQIDCAAVPTTSILSPQESFVTSRDNSLKPVPVDPGSNAYVVPMAVPVVSLGTPQPPVVPEKPVPLTIPQQHLVHEFPQPAAAQPVHQPLSFIGPHLETISRQTNYVHPPNPNGFPNQHLLARPASPFIHQPFQGNSLSISSHQLLPPANMTMTASTPHMGVRPVVIQPAMQAQETRLENFPDEIGHKAARFVALPTEQTYPAYPGSTAPGLVSGGYVRPQVAPSDKVLLPDVPVPLRPVVMPEKLYGVEDLHMYHKPLPHSHSDPVVRERKSNDASSVPYASSAYRSFHPDDAMRILQMERILNHIEHQERDVVQKDNIQIKPSEPVFREIMKELPNKIPVVIQKEIDAVPIVPHDGVRQLGGLMENLKVVAPEIYTKGENYIPPTGKIQRADNSDCKSQHVAGRDMVLDNTLIGQSPTVNNTAKPTEMLLNTIGVPPGHESQPMESYGPAQSPFLGNPILCPQTMVGCQHLNSSELQSNNPAYSAVQSAYDAANLPSALSSSAGAGDVKDSSNSLFSNQDPWNLQRDGHPPRANKVQINMEGFGGHFDENQPAMSGIPNSETHLQDGIPRARTNSNKDLKAEQSRSSKGSEEEHIRQELRTVAEGVAASVFRSSSNPELPAKMHESASDTNQEGEVSQTDEDNQQTAHLKDMRTKLPEMLNFGYLDSDCLDQLQIIKDSDLEELRELGSGTFGTVYHGKWRGTDVAIKRINDRCFAGKPSEQERMIDDFWNEAKKLAGLHHPNVVAFYGVVLDSPGGSVATVTEYMVNGSLRNALQKNVRNVDKRKRLMIAMDVAFGMEYLHGKNIVHFDLKSDNLLVNLRDPHRPICKVGDLGLSKVKCQTLISGGVRGTLPWMAPELLNGISSLVSEKVDVFSYGIVLWELLTGEEPYADLHYGAIIGGIVSNTLRPPIPDFCELDWRLLMERCWSADPAERPSFVEIANELRLMAAKLPSKGQSQSQPQSQP